MIKIKKLRLDNQTFEVVIVSWLPKNTFIISDESFKDWLTRLDKIVDTLRGEKNE